MRGVLKDRSAPRCALHIRRRYGRPGQCEKRKNVKRVDYCGESILACTVHGKMITEGRRFEAAR